MKENRSLGPIAAALCFGAMFAVIAYSRFHESRYRYLRQLDASDLERQFMAERVSARRRFIASQN